MKKYVSILSVLILVLGFASLSYSAPAEIPSDTTAVVAKGQTKITLGGDIRFRGFAIENRKVLESDTYASSRNYMDYRVQLRLKAELSPNTTGFIMLQSGAPDEPNVTWGSQQGGARGAYQVGNTKESQMWIHTAYIQYQGSGLLGVPAGIKIGRDIIKLGNGIFLFHTRLGDDQIMAYVQPVKELTLALATVKFREGNSDLSDDATAYALIGAYKGKNFELSADVTYLDDQGNANSTAVRGCSGLNPDGTCKTPWPMNDKFGPNSDLHLWNFGIRGSIDDIAQTGLGARADIELQTGKIVNTKLGYEPKLKGWAGLAGLNYKFKTIPLTLKAEYQVGSGHGDSKDIKEYITAIGRLEGEYTTLVYEYYAPSACDSQLSPYARETGLCNTQYVIFGGAGDITKSLSAQLYGFWIRANKAVNINSYTDKSKDVGYEVDTMITYKIDKNLKYWIEAGYFWPGDAWKLKNGKDPDNAWVVRHSIMLTF